MNHSRITLADLVKPEYEEIDAAITITSVRIPDLLIACRWPRLPEQPS